MASQLDMFPAAPAAPMATQLAPQDFGEKGRRAWFWQDGAWQVGKAWEIGIDGRVAGMCRDYGPWGSPYPGSMPLQTHGRWQSHEVAWKRPADQYMGPVNP